MSMAKKISAGEYQIGVWSVVMVRGKRWEAQAVGPGTVDADPIKFRTLADAYLHLTGEPLHSTRHGESNVE